MAEVVNAPSPGEYWCEMTVNGVDVRTNTFVWHEDGSYEFLDDFVLPTSLISIAPQGDSRIGDIIRLGGYDWRILDVQEGKAFIITEYVYISGPFHALDSPANLPQNAVYSGALVTWETSGLRSYLNGEFYDGFSDEEKRKILDTTINCDNPYSNVYGGNETTDKVFLLSAEEVVRYLLFDGGEIVEGDGRTIYSMPGILNFLTPLAIMSEGGEPTHDWDGDWWLRTIGSGFSSMDNSIPVLTAGGDNGNPDRFELELTHKLSSEPSGVRPAMWIALDGDAVGGSAPTQPSAPPSTDSPVQADRLAITLQIGNSAESYEGVYRGEVLNNLPNGQGSATFTNAIGEQQTYTGSWEAGHFEGEGKWEDSGYLKYEGVFENNLMVSGKMYDNSGQLYYEGDFREGLRDENAAALQARIDGYAAEAVLYDGRDWADYDDGQIVAYECVLEEVIPDMFSVAIGTMQPNGKSVYRENYSPAYGETIPPVGSQVVLYYRVFRDSDFGSTHEALLACVPM